MQPQREGKVMRRWHGHGRACASSLDGTDRLALVARQYVKSGGPRPFRTATISDSFQVQRMASVANWRNLRNWPDNENDDLSEMDA